MRDAEPLVRSTCSEIGALVAKGECFALRRQDGAEFWLEMDRIPMHLLDQRVKIEGSKYESDLISVDMIGPA